MSEMPQLPAEYLGRYLGGDQGEMREEEVEPRSCGGIEMVATTPTPYGASDMQYSQSGVVIWYD